MTADELKVVQAVHQENARLRTAMLEIAKVLPRPRRNAHSTIARILRIINSTVTMGTA